VIFLKKYYLAFLKMNGNFSNKALDLIVFELDFVFSLSLAEQVPNFLV
jgi:hypothetical protein